MFVRVKGVGAKHSSTKGDICKNGVMDCKFSFLKKEEKKKGKPN